MGQLQETMVSGVWSFCWYIQYSIQKIHFNFCFWNPSIKQSGKNVILQNFMLNGIQEQKSKWMIWMVKRNHHQSNHSAGTLIPWSYLKISAFAENAEMVAVENYIVVGSIPGETLPSSFTIIFKTTVLQIEVKYLRKCFPDIF